MKSAIIIPARLDSTRLARKMMLSETGKTLIEHTWLAAKTSRRADQVIVATDSEEIHATVEKFGGEAVMTSCEHRSGSDRVAEACHNSDAEIIINLQGDEPEIQGQHLDALIERLACDNSIDVVTLACPILSLGQLQDTSRVKVVMNHDRQALYFSRSPIPGAKHASGVSSYFDQLADKPVSLEEATYFQHIGIYGYRKAGLLKLPELKPSKLEETESLEQLRFLANGWTIGIELVSESGSGIDTAEDYTAFVNRLRNS